MVFEIFIEVVTNYNRILNQSRYSQKVHEYRFSEEKRYNIILEILIGMSVVPFFILVMKMRVILKLFTWEGDKILI